MKKAKKQGKSIGRPRQPGNFITAGEGRSMSGAARLETLEGRTLFALTVTPFNPGASPASLLTNALVSSGTGISVTNSTFVGQSGQAGRFTGFTFGSGASGLTLGDGIVLTSGTAKDAEGPNDDEQITTEYLTPGDSNLNTLISTPTDPQTTQDANALTITFTTPGTTKSLLFDFVFGSDEFPEFVGDFNDVFGAYLDGKQISFDSNNKPITVNNNFFQLNNSGITDATDEPDVAGKTVVNYNIQYDGLTPRITTQAPLSSAATHTLKLVIADTSDALLDSGVFLSRLRGSTLVSGEPTTGQSPTANAGGPYTVAAGGTVVLDGTKSSDPDTGQTATLNYKWDLDGDGIFGETGSAAGRGNETGSKPTFNSAGLPAGPFTVSLRVTDTDGLTDTDTAVVTVTAVANKPPVAKVNGPYTINEGAGATFSAAGSSDPDGNPLTYSWDINGDGTFGDTTGINPTLTAAQLKTLGIADGNASSIYNVKVQVNDGKVSTTSAATTLTVKNVAPTVNAGADKSTALNAAVTLTGSATDPAGAADPLAFSWVIKNAGGTTVGTSSAAIISFTPTVAGTYTATLTVTDGDGGTGTDSALIVANAPNNGVPTAKAGGPYVINEGSGVILNGSGSSDPDGNPLTYSWDINGDGTFGDATGVSPNVSWTQLKALGITDGNATSVYSLKVRVSDGIATIVSPATTLTVKNVAPTANASPDKATLVNTAVTLTGSATDPGDSDPLTYSWVVTNSANVTVATSSAKNLTFTPTTAGTFTATLTVSDDDGGSDTDSALITAAPVTTGGPKITKFVLVDADRDVDLMVLDPTKGPVTLNLAALPRKLNIRAEANGETQSVLLTLDGKSLGVEQAEPYALFSDLQGDYKPGTFKTGLRTLVATAFANDFGAGTPGSAMTLQLNVINAPPAATSKATSLELFNTATGAKIKTLKMYEVLKLSTLPATIGIRATTTGGATSIVYRVDKLVQSTAAALTVGKHQITAIPVKNGLEGDSFFLNITVVA